MDNSRPPTWVLEKGPDGKLLSHLEWPYTYIFIIRLYEKVYVFIFCSFAPYQNNTSPLYMASQNGHNDVVQSLLSARADVNMARSIVGYVFV